jgi:hypothetical protein
MTKHRKNSKVSAAEGQTPETGVVLEKQEQPREPKKPVQTNPAPFKSRKETEIGRAHV